MEWHTLGQGGTEARRQSFTLELQVLVASACLIETKALTPFFHHSFTPFSDLQSEARQENAVLIPRSLPIGRKMQTANFTPTTPAVTCNH